MMRMASEEDIKTAARRWLLRLSLESPTELERAQFTAWCADDPRHAAAYRRFETIWHEAATLEELKSLVSFPPARDAWWRRARANFVNHTLRWSVSASLAAAIAGFVLWFLLTPVYYATGIAEVRDIHLSDGSEVTLGARSSLEVAFGLHERRVALTSGVAFFSVSKNPARPFIVLVGDKEVRVVGTKFEIRRDVAEMRVSVVEGTVEVMQAPGLANQGAREEAPRNARLAAKVTRPASATIPNSAPIAPTLLTLTEDPEERILAAGQRVTAALAGAIADPQVMPRGEPAAWRHGRLVYVDAPLKDIIADANRYSRVPIEIEDEAVANVRVSVTYPSDRIEEMVSALSRSLGLEIEHRESGGIVLKAKRPND
jgi:transmembrane sensor